MYLILDLVCLGEKDPALVASESIAGGATCIQLRAKDVPDITLLKTGQTIRRITLKHNVPLIVNDRLDMALALDADGVHLGQDDIPVQIARRILGRDKVIGATVETPEEAKTAEREGASYLGTGPVFVTTTKPDAGDAYGPSLIRKIKAATLLPVVAVGGISAQNARLLRRAAADGIAVASAVLGRDDTRQATREIKNAFLGVRDQGECK